MSQMLSWPPSWATLFLLPGLLVAFTVHELAHAVVAYLLGDTSQVERKRLSLNPLRHISWLGMIAFLLVGIGWAKPVMVDWTRFRIKNRAFGMFLVSISGAGANLLTALLVGAAMLMTASVVWMMTGAPLQDVIDFMLVSNPGPDLHGLAVALSTYMVWVNLLIALFNLLPLPPLDGFQALMSLFSMIRSAIKGEPGPTSRPAVVTAPEEEAQRSPAQIHFDIALTYHKAGELDEAIARYRQAIAHDDQFGLAYYNLGLAYLAKERSPLAASAFRAALKARGDMAVQVEASRRLRELSQAEEAPDAEPAARGSPLEPGSKVEGSAGGAAPLDPAIARRLWLRLSLGAALAIVLGGAAWLFVAVVMLGALG